MTKAERAPYHHLAWKFSKECRRVGLDYDIGICTLCRFAESDFDEARCAHPSEAIRAKVEDNALMNNVDCWAFRPQQSLADAEGYYRSLIAETEAGNK